MVPLPIVRSVNEELVKTHPLVAVFVGGTSGIGSNTIKALARTHASSSSMQTLRVYIVARNAEIAKKLISECEEICPKGRFMFLQSGDLALIKDVDVICKELMKVEEKEGGKFMGDKARIDILVMSHAIFAPGAPRCGKLYSI